MEYLTSCDVNIHALVQETKNDQMLDVGDLGVARAVSMREIVACFGNQQAM
ncbi:MAG: hypothetical protein AAF066_16250 [Pseudomonadota bacterium]